MNFVEHLANRLANQFCNLRYGSRDWSGPQPKIIAHRGVHEGGMCRENSLAAFIKAEQIGLWGIEFDIRWTADNVPVIYHDPDLQRLHGHPLKLSENTLDALLKVAPDLVCFKDLIDRLAGKLHFMIEVKTPIAFLDRKKILQKMLSQLAPEQDYHFMSLRADVLDSLDWIDSRALVDIAWFDVNGMARNSIRKNHGGMAGHFLLLNQRRIRQFHAAGLSVGTGYIENKGTLTREMERGVDWIFTNTPMSIT